MLMYAFAFSCIHSFYPNMSNFLQQRFGFNNEDAGHIASLPYIIAGFSTPFLGMVISKFGDAYYELLGVVASGLIFCVHFSLVLMSDINPGDDPKYLAVAPIGLFGFAHALLVTVSAPTVK